MSAESPSPNDPILDRDAALRVAQLACAIQAGKASFGAQAAIDMTFGVLNELDKFVQPELKGLKWLGGKQPA